MSEPILSFEALQTLAKSFTLTWTHAVEHPETGKIACVTWPASEEPWMVADYPHGSLVCREETRRKLTEHLPIYEHTNTPYGGVSIWPVDPRELQRWYQLCVLVGMALNPQHGWVLTEPVMASMRRVAEEK